MQLIQVDPEILIPKTKNAWFLTPPNLLRSSLACIRGCDRAGGFLVGKASAQSGKEAMGGVSGGGNVGGMGGSKHVPPLGILRPSVPQ